MGTDREDIDLMLNQFSKTGAAGIRNRALLSLMNYENLKPYQALALKKATTNHAGTQALLELWKQKRKELGIPKDTVLFCTFSRKSWKPMDQAHLRKAIREARIKAGLDVTPRFKWRRNLDAPKNAEVNLPDINIVLTHNGVTYVVSHINP